MGLGMAVSSKRSSKEIIRRKIKFAEVNKTELAAFMF